LIIISLLIDTSVSYMVGGLGFISIQNIEVKIEYFYLI